MKGLNLSSAIPTVPYMVGSTEYTRIPVQQLAEHAGDALPEIIDAVKSQLGQFNIPEWMEFLSQLEEEKPEQVVEAYESITPQVVFYLMQAKASQRFLTTLEQRGINTTDTQKLASLRQAIKTVYPQAGFSDASFINDWRTYLDQCNKVLLRAAKKTQDPQRQTALAFISLPTFTISTPFPEDRIVRQRKPGKGRFFLPIDQIQALYTHGLQIPHDMRIYEKQTEDGHRMVSFPAQWMIHANLDDPILLHFLSQSILTQLKQDHPERSLWQASRLHQKVHDPESFLEQLSFLRQRAQWGFSQMEAILLAFAQTNLTDLHPLNPLHHHLQMVLNNRSREMFEETFWKQWKQNICVPAALPFSKQVEILEAIA